MRRLLCWLLALAMCVSLVGCAAGETFAADDFTLFMVDVGKGDAIIVSAGGRYYLIDAGYAYMWGRVNQALRSLGITRLDGVFLTHTDKDHAGGMMMLAMSDYEVDEWYSSGYSIDYEEAKHPMTLAAAHRGKQVNWLYAGDEVDGLFFVLAPSVLFEDKDDNNSLVMMLRTRYGKALLTGDMELPQERVLFASGAQLACDVLKVANHADDDTTSWMLIQKTGASIALISTDPYEKPGTPSSLVLENLSRAGMSVMRTDQSGIGILVTASAEGVFAQYQDAPAREAPALVNIASVNAQADLIALASDTEVDISGWYLYSSRGDECFLLKRGTLITPDGLVIGTRTSPAGTYDMLWDDTNVIHNKKDDTITLYDSYGAYVTSAGNGF